MIYFTGDASETVMKRSIKIVKAVIITLFCVVCAAGNLYNFTGRSQNAAYNIIFFDIDSKDNASDNNKYSENETADPTDDENQTGKININTAGVNELIRLPGIGETKAKSIIAYREAYGGFVAIEEIMEVKGIGQSTFEKIKDLITIN